MNREEIWRTWESGGTVKMTYEVGRKMLDELYTAKQQLVLAERAGSRTHKTIQAKARFSTIFDMLEILWACDSYELAEFFNEYWMDREKQRKDKAAELLEETQNVYIQQGPKPR